MFRKAVYYVTFPAATLPHCCANKPASGNWRFKAGKLGWEVYRPSFLVYPGNGAFGQQTSTAGALPVSWRRSKRNLGCLQVFCLFPGRCVAG